MIFDGVTCNTPEDINRGWKNYFQCLYTPSSHNSYDEEFRRSIIPKAEKLKHSAKTTDSSNINITVPDVLMALKSCKNNKSCGYDGIYYEHMKKGGSVLIDCLKLLFRKMCEFGYCPINMKRGIIATLFKGGNKDKRNPNSYRAISLCSTVLKVYEKIILQKIHELDKIKFHGLQGGFQNNLNCLSTAFMARECINFARENDAKLYTCYLDASQAFDNVDFDILLHKLNTSGVSMQFIKVIISLLKDIYSCVRCDGIKSEWFEIQKGARQGQCLSAFFYVVYITSLIEKLDVNRNGLNINGSSFSCPTVADDMMLFSLSPHGLQSMIDICNKNATKDRYHYNATKCNVIVFNESKTKFNSSNRIWNLGELNIEETTSYTHLGILCDKYHDLSENVKTCCSKLRRTYFSLNDYGLNQNALHPLTLKNSISPQFF